MSLLYHEIKSKLNEMDHETKTEDYTNASSSFDDIFLDRDYIRSKSGHTIVFIEIDKDAYEVRDSKGYNGLWAYSKDTYNWTLLKGKRSINKTITGSPIEIARYIADWYDKEAK